MGEFLFPDKEEIIEDVRQNLEDANMPVTDWSSGSANRTFWEIVAQREANQNFMLKRLFQSFFVDGDELSGEDLDRRVAERGLKRKIGFQASGKIKCSRSTPAPFDIEILEGVTFSTLDGEVVVQTLQDVCMKTGESEIELDVAATELGYSGNLVIQTELIQSGIAIMGVETINVSEGFSGGVDTESDDSLRARYLDKIRNPDGAGTKKDYERWAVEVSGVTTAKCIKLARGPGTLDVIITTEGGLPPEELIVQCTEYIKERMMFNQDFLIRSPITIPLDISIVYYSESVVDEQVKEAVSTYIRSVGVGGIVRLSSLIVAIRSIPSVSDVEVSIPEHNVMLTENEMAVIGNMSIQKGII